MVEQHAAFAWPAVAPVRLEDHRGEHLDPVSDELAMARVARTPVAVQREPAGAMASPSRGLPVGAPGPTAMSASAMYRAANS